VLLPPLLEEVGGEGGKAAGLLTSNGSISPFIKALLPALGYCRVPSGGAGNKVIKTV
jgi:hypothetical protein